MESNRCAERVYECLADWNARGAREKGETQAKGGLVTLL